MMQYHIVDIVHIDENMTQLIDFHSLESSRVESTFSDGMHRQGLLQFIQHTGELAKLLWQAPIFLSFGQHQNSSQMFSKSQQKRQVLGDLRVCTGFGLKKQHC